MVKKYKKYLTVFAVLAFAGATAWYLLGGKKNEIQYKTQKVERGELLQTVSANGTLNPVVLVNVGTQVSGTVKQLLVDYNARVKQGEVLAVLDPALFDAQVAQSGAVVESAKASYELAKANEKRVRELFEKEYVSAKELDSAVEALKSAKAALAQANAAHKKDLTNKGYSIIKSPVSGVVIDRQIDIGQTVAASFQTPTLFKIAKDLKQMQIDSLFAEADIGKIKEGQEVFFNVDAFGNRRFEGRVRQIRLNATTQSNVVTYNVVISVDNGDELLMPGMTAYVSIKTAERKNVLLVPNSALRFKPTTDEKDTQKPNKKIAQKEKTGTVYLLKSGKPVATKVRLGITDNRQTEILGDELKEGDEVITEELSKKDKKQSQPARLF